MTKVWIREIAVFGQKSFFRSKHGQNHSARRPWILFFLGDHPDMDFEPGYWILKSEQSVSKIEKNTAATENTATWIYYFYLDLILHGVILLLWMKIVEKISILCPKSPKIDNVSVLFSNCFLRAWYDIFCLRVILTVVKLAEIYGI